MATACNAKVESIISFSTCLLERLNLSADIQSDSFADLSVYLHALPLRRSSLSRAQSDVLRHNAVELWNSCNRHDHYEKDTEANTISAKARAFSYLILASVTEHDSTFTGSKWRLFQIASNAAQRCLRACEVDIAYKILANEAEILDLPYEKLDKSDTSSHREREIANFNCLRVAVEWKRGRLDLAEHFFNRFCGESYPYDSLSFEQVVDLAYEIGNDELLKDNCNTAALWLRRARLLLTSHPAFKASLDASDLPMTVSHTYVRALIGLKKPNSDVEAQEIAKELRQEYGERLSVLLLQLELHVQDKTPDYASFYEDLSATIRFVHLTESNHKLILHYILKLRDLSIVHALQCLHFYISYRLGPHGNHAWIDKAILTYIWLSSIAVENDQSSSVDHLPTAFDNFEKACCQKLSSDVAHAGHVLVWKILKIAENQGLSSHIALCCQIALHPLLDQAGDQTLGQFERRLLRHYLVTSDISTAQALLKRVPSSRKQHKLTRFLAYCISLRTGNDEDVCIALGSLNNLQAQDQQLIFAYAAESLQRGNGIQGARALQRILDKDHRILGSEVNIFTFLRCIISLLVNVLSQKASNIHDDHEPLKRLCGAFKTATTFTIDHKIGAEAKLKSNECQFLRNCCYNLALQHLKSWPANYVIDLLEYSSKLNNTIDIKSFHLDSEKTIVHDINVTFIQAVLYVQRARQTSSDSPLCDLPQTSFTDHSKPHESEQQLVLYRNAFERFTKIHQAFTSNGKAVRENSKLKLTIETTIPLAFEALLFMNAQAIASDDHFPYDDVNLSSLVSFAVTQEAPARIFALLAEILLSYCSNPESPEQHVTSPSDTKMPLVVAARVLGRIIEVYKTKSDYDLPRAAQWLRCLIQVTLDYLQHEISHHLWLCRSQAQRKEQLQVLHSTVGHCLSLARTALKVGERRGEDRECRDLPPCDEMQLSDSTIVRLSEEKRADGQLYPPQELEWIAISLFNIGIDFHLTNEEARAMECTRAALEVADTLALYDMRWQGDGRGLEETRHYILSDIIRNKISKLGWSV